MTCSHRYTIKADGLTTCLGCEQCTTADGTVIDPKSYKSTKKVKSKPRFVRPSSDVE